MMGHPYQESSQAKLEEFKRLKSDRKTHPEAVQNAWTAFIEAVEQETTSASSVEVLNTPPARQGG